MSKVTKASKKVKMADVGFSDIGSIPSISKCKVGAFNGNVHTDLLADCGSLSLFGTKVCTEAGLVKKSDTFKPDTRELAKSEAPEPELAEPETERVEAEPELVEPVDNLPKSNQPNREKLEPKMPDDRLSSLDRAILRSGTEITEMADLLDYELKHPYIAKRDILTKAEAKLFKLMDKVFNEKLECLGSRVVIFPKMRMADIIDVQSSLNYKESGYFYKIACKHIDFLVCDIMTMNVIFAVELDDSYHYRTDKIARDKFVNETLEDCKIKLFRVDEPIRYVNEKSLAKPINFLLQYFAPTCAYCGHMMVPRRAGKGERSGHLFYGCSEWKRGGRGCNYTINID